LAQLLRSEEGVCSVRASLHISELHAHEGEVDQLLTQYK